MEKHSPNYAILEVILRFGVFKLDMEGVINTDLEFDWDRWLGVQFWCGDLHREIDLFADVGVVIPEQSRSEVVSDFAGNTVECFIRLLEPREFKWQTPIFR